MALLTLTGAGLVRMSSSDYLMVKQNTKNTFLLFGWCDFERSRKFLKRSRYDEMNGVFFCRCCVRFVWQVAGLNVSQKSHWAEIVCWY